jgi:cell division protein FtsW
MGEEFGFFFTTAFLAAFLTFILRGLSIAERADDQFGRFLVVGIMAWLGVQALVNIGSMVGMMPITGVPLPFLSYGGTSLAISLAAIGLVLNVSKYASPKN